MSIDNSLKFFLLFILTNSLHVTFSQEKFIRFQDFRVAYITNPNLNDLSKDYNLLFISLLDTACRKEIFEYDLELKDLYLEYSYGMQMNASTVGFVAHVQKLDDVFNSNRLISKVYHCILDTVTQQAINRKIGFPIYIKDNIAIVEVISDKSSDIYYFRLKDGVVQINWLGGVIE
ncbi:MAG: hypothetical protein KKF98_07365 [Bacteroidetes bacterium]|nr:hypothetical protein [Bacteroidota bacterium]